MANNKELCSVALEQGGRYCIAVHITGSRIELRLSSKIGRRCNNKVGFNFGFAVFLSRDRSVFGDHGTVIVGRVASSVTQISPIGTSVSLVVLKQTEIERQVAYHVDVENAQAKAEIILEKYTLELVVN
jgi:hypothetical protein